MPLSLQTSRRFLKVKTVSASTTCDGSELQCDRTVAEEVFPNVQSRSVLLELEFMSSRTITTDIQLEKGGVVNIFSAC